MLRFVRYTIPVLAMVVAVFLGSSSRAEVDLYKPIPEDVILGKADAPVVMIEYASLSCPHCAHFHATAFPTIKQKYIDTGKVKFIFRPFPLDLPALRGTMISYCSGNDHFYTFLKVLFETQESWAFNKNFLEMLANIGKLGGVTAKQFDACMADKKLEERILETKQKGANVMQIKATPTFFINGQKIDGGRSAEELSVLIDGLLTGKPAAKKEASPVVKPK